MLHLTTFGGCALAHETRGEAIAIGQRRPLALLAVLAAAGEAGATRERVAALLWPEADAERGRRSLAQAVYQLRRLTGEEELFQGAPELRLNAAVFGSDRGEFERALHDGRLAEAAELYKGPFLEGFSVPGADAFERWLEGERRELQHRCADALRALIASARRARDHARAIAWGRRLAALDPLDSSAALLLMDVLAEGGDVAGALRTAQIHEALLGDQLELPLPESIRARVSALREGATQGTADAPALPTPPRPESESTADASQPAPRGMGDERSPVAKTEIDPAPLVPTWMRGRLGWIAGGVALVVASLGAGVVIGRATAPADAPVPASARAAPPPDEGVVAVLPFTTADADSTGLGAEVAAQLSRALSGDIGPRALDPGLVIDAVQDEARNTQGRRSRAGSRAAARAMAERLGAGEVVVGRVRGSPDDLTVSATLVSVRSGVERASADARGRADELPDLVAELAARLLAERELDAERARAFPDVALPPLRAYLRAESAFRDERYEEAVRLYAKALDDDSTFAPAALGLAVAADRFNAAEQHDRGLALAWAARDRLGERDRAFLSALAGPRYPEPSPAEEQVAAWERLVTLAGDRAAVWVELGERFFYDGAALGIRGAEVRATNAFRRALALDPSNAPALRHLIEIAARASDTAALSELAAEERLARTGLRLPGYIRWRVATARGDSATLRRLRLDFPSLLTSSLRATAMASQHDGIAIGDGELALRTIATRVALGSEQLDLLLARHSLALNTGRGALALRVTQELEEAQPWSRAHLRLRVLDALYSVGDVAAAKGAAAELARTADAPMADDEPTRALQLADACVLAQWRVLREGESPAALDAARAAVQALRRAGIPRTPVPVGSNPRACADLVDAMLAVAGGLPDAAKRVSRLEAMTLAGTALNDARTYAAIAVSRMAEQLGDLPRALATIRRRGYLKGWPRYLSTARRMEAQLVERIAASPEDSLTRR